MSFPPHPSEVAAPAIAQTSFSSWPRRTLRGLLYIAAATFCWGLAATLGRAAFTGRLRAHGIAVETINPLILSQTRVTFSFIALLVFLFPSRGGNLFKLKLSEFWSLARLGVFGLAAANFFYYLAIQRTNVAVAITVQYTSPIWVLLYMAVRGREPVTLRRLSAVILCIIGIAAAIGLFSSFRVHLDSIGIFAAVLAALACAFYNIHGHDAMESESRDHWTVVFYMTFTATLFWLLLSPPWKIAATQYSGVQWLFLAVFAVVSMLVPFSFYFAGLRYLDPTSAIVASCLEPVFAISITAIALGETIHTLQIAGMIAVIAGIVLVQLPETRQRDPNSVSVC